MISVAGANLTLVHVLECGLDRFDRRAYARTMPRKLRIQYPGAMYHVMSCGDRGERIFRDDVERHDFIKTLAEACQKKNG
jgi:hypothetical protein